MERNKSDLKRYFFVLVGIFILCDYDNLLWFINLNIKNWYFLCINNE